MRTIRTQRTVPQKQCYVLVFRPVLVSSECKLLLARLMCSLEVMHMYLIYTFKLCGLSLPLLHLKLQP